MDPKRKPNILIVDDEPEFAELIGERLQRSGFKIQLSSSVSEACSKLSNQVFDCVLLDIRLKLRTGEMVVEYIRTNPKGFNYHTPIIIMSGFLEPSLIAKIGGVIQGALVKPIDGDLLIAKINSLVAAPSLKND